jgi:hypothetical protein
MSMFYTRMICNFFVNNDPSSPIFTCLIYKYGEIIGFVSAKWEKRSGLLILYLKTELKTLFEQKKISTVTPIDKI